MKKICKKGHALQPSASREFEVILIHLVPHKQIMESNISDVVGHRLKEVQGKRGKIIKRLDIVAACNIFLVIPPIVILIFVVMRFMIRGIRFRSSHDQTFCVTVASIFILNITALVVYLVAVARRRKDLLLVYIVANFTFVIVQVSVCLTLYTGAQIQDEEKIPIPMTVLFVITLILIGLNSAITSYVNFKVHQLTGYTQTFNNTLTNSITLSKQTSSGLGSRLPSKADAGQEIQ